MADDLYEMFGIERTEVDERVKAVVNLVRQTSFATVLECTAVSEVDRLSGKRLSISTERMFDGRAFGLRAVVKDGGVGSLYTCFKAPETVNDAIAMGIRIATAYCDSMREKR